MIMTKMGNNSDTKKIIFAGNEIKKAYHQNNLVWQSSQVVNNVIDSVGYVAIGTDITGGTEHLKAPFQDIGGTNWVYSYFLGTSNIQSGSQSHRISDGTTTLIMGTMNLGIFAGKTIEKITALLTYTASIYRLTDQPNGRITFIIKDNLGNSLWTTTMNISVGTSSGYNNCFTIDAPITLTPNRAINSLRLSIVYSNISLETARDVYGAFGFGFRSMNIQYR